MKTLGRKICCMLCCGLMFCSLAFGGEKNTAGKKVFSWDFSDCEIRDILYAVSFDTGISIVPDDTVKGRGDFRFTGSDFEKAFDSFLNLSRMYVSKKDDVWTVSRFSLVESDGLYTLNVCDLSAEQIVEKLSLFLGGTITYEVLPLGAMNMHFKGLSEQELLENVCLRLDGYELEKHDTGYHFARKVNSLGAGMAVAGYMNIHRTSDGGIFVDVKDSKVSDVLEAVFGCGKDVEFKETGFVVFEQGSLGENGIQFCVLVNNDTKISRACFKGKDFADTLEKLCAQNGLSFVVSDGVYYVMADSNARDNLISGKKEWFKVSLEYTKAEKFVSILGRRFGKIDTIVLPDEMSLLICADALERTEIESLRKDVDLKTDIYLVELKYIRPDDFVKYLPPDVDRGCLFFADDNSSVYFKGTEAAYLSLCDQLAICDRPVVRLSYDLLILQYDEGKENSWNPGFSVERMKIGDSNDFGIKLGNVLNLNLNVISAFGLDFAAQLQASLEENKTLVFADTTLHGVAGKQINFQNTNTYRYRDNNLDPSTGVPVYSGVTKEIVSGLKLEVTGFVSGDGMITSSVTASVTRQGMDTSASTGNPPPTSEKIVTTEVCGKSGEPIVISGLIQNSSSQGSNGVPLMSKVPLLGWMFKSHEKIAEKTQMVIYLVPHIQMYGSEKDGNNAEDVRNNSGWIWEHCDKLSRKICEENQKEMENEKL